MAQPWKPAYLVHGDDHGRIAERRAALRARAEAESGTVAVEVLGGDAADADRVAAELSAMTLGFGRRFVIVEGVERWRAADVHEYLTPALEVLAPDTTVAFFAREEGRDKAPEALAKSVVASGGEVIEQMKVKAKDLPRWLSAEAGRIGISLDGAAAQILIAHVGDRQQRLTRELEKLAIEYGNGARIGVEEAEEAALSSEREVWGLLDAIGSRNRRAAFRAYMDLRDQGQPIARLLPLMVRRVRDLHEIAERLERRQSPQQIKEAVGGNPWAVDKRIAEARGADPRALAQSLITLAELELKTRGLGDQSSDETAAIRAIGRITAVV